MTIQTPHNIKLKDRQSLKSILDNARARGLKVVFTNGCFDILHSGHVDYLRRAKSLGDILVVGLNTDKSVSSIKKGRPLSSELDRAYVLSALEMVDYVVLFDELTPLELITSLSPDIDILVKGGDWKKEDIVGSGIVPLTLSLPFLEGFSTTDIIRKIKQSTG